MRNILMWGSLLAVAGLLCLPVGSQAANLKLPAPGRGTLSGRVTLWPVSPAERPGSTPAPRPAAGIKLQVYGPFHEEVAALTTDADGQFRVDLPPGLYQLVMALGQGKAFTKDLPAMVTIARGQESRLDIRLDTGMR
jgi:hypothetical protein